MPYCKSLWGDIVHLLPEYLRVQLRSSAEHENHKMDDDCVQALIDQGYLRLAIPEKLGGLGATLLESCAVQYQIGMENPAMAVGLNMHLFTVGLMVEHWSATKDLSWMLLEGIAKKNCVVASAFAEPGLGGNVLHSHTKATHLGKGRYRLQGLKVPCSLAARSDLICLQAMTDEDREDRLIVALVPTKTPGISMREGQKTLGMKCSESDMVILEGCEIPSSLIFHRTKPGVDEGDTFASGMVWFALTASAVYLGLTRRAMDLAVEGLHKARFGDGRTRSESPGVQSRLGELSGRLLSQELACTSAAQLAEKIETSQTLSHAFSVKQSTVRECQKIVTELMHLVGGATYLENHPLSRSLRNVTAAAFHPPTEPVLHQTLGRMELGMPWAMHLME
ncbi:MAG: acyl-CoA dehydrogenase family protein [Oligoflexales bacterium]